MKLLGAQNRRTNWNQTNSAPKHGIFRSNFHELITIQHLRRITFPLEPIFRPITDANYRSAAEEPSGTIIAGTGSHEKTFYAPQSALEKSPVIKGWIEDKESIPTSLQKGGALYFPECDPEVVHVVIEYLNSTTDGLIAILDPSAGESKDVLFYVKVYKFALCLG
jgi:hypothetical protein